MTGYVFYTTSGLLLQLGTNGKSESLGMEGAEACVLDCLRSSKSPPGRPSEEGAVL